MFLEWSTKFSFQKVLGILSFGPCPNCMNSANIVAEIQFKFLKKGILSTGEPCTCEYVGLLQLFHRGTLSLHWYIAENVLPTFSMSVLFRCSSKTAMSSNGGFSPEFSLLMLKKIIPLVWEYVLYKTRKEKAKLAEKYYIIYYFSRINYHIW